MPLRLICYDLHHDPLAWEQIVKANVDVALLKNVVRPPGYLVPYIGHAHGEWFTGEAKKKKGRSAVVGMQGIRSCTFLRPNLALIRLERNDQETLFYVHDDHSPQLLAFVAHDIELDRVICSSDPIPHEMGCERVYPELYSLQAPPPLVVYTKGGARFKAHEVIDTMTGVQSDPQMVITVQSRRLLIGSIIFQAVGESEEAFRDWLKSGERVYVRSLNVWGGLVDCSQIRLGTVPMIMDMPITHWCRFVRGCPKCGEELFVFSDGECVYSCETCEYPRQGHY